MKHDSPVLSVDVLVVEDDGDSAELYTFALAHAGFGVTKTHNRLEAIEALQQKHYQVIVMDVQMAGPTLDQFMAFRNSLFPESKLILISAYQQLDEMARKHDIQCLLRKPFDTMKLRETISRAIAIDEEPGQRNAIAQSLHAGLPPDPIG
jgi:DNA-binding NtrC family response regulator